MYCTAVTVYNCNKYLRAVFLRRSKSIGNITISPVFLSNRDLKKN